MAAKGPAAAPRSNFTASAQPYLVLRTGGACQFSDIAGNVDINILPEASSARSRDHGRCLGDLRFDAMSRWSTSVPCARWMASAWTP